ncbi:MAG: hypothetical protein JXA90_08540 [Planctomycetes bacterium]|nr:hypothetical protein [Planctomycetota bacterium]
MQEEHNLVPLGGESPYCVYRMRLGYPYRAYSADGGRRWSPPEPMVYPTGGRILKQPRASPKPWR